MSSTYVNFSVEYPIEEVARKSLPLLIKYLKANSASISVSDSINIVDYLSYFIGRNVMPYSPLKIK